MLEVTIAALLVAAASLVIAGLALVNAREATAISARAADASERSAASSETAASAADRSASAAEASALASKTANELASEALELQLAETQALADARRRSRKARVVALCFDGSVNARYRGLNVKNEGPAVASEVVGFVGYPNGQYNRTVVYPSISPGETVGIIGWDAEGGYDGLAAQMPPVPQQHNALRVVWKSEDREGSDSGWSLVRERS